MSASAKSALALASLVFIAAAVASACGDEPTKFGTANGLKGEQPEDHPPPGGSSGTSGTSGDGGTSSGGTCTPAIEAGACPTFSKDIEGLFASAGSWGCAQTACHGAANAPKITGTDPNADYTTLTTYQGGNNKPYINPNSSALTDNAIDCDIQGATQALTAHCWTGASMPSGKTPTPAEITTLENWIKCCSPK